MDLIAACGDDGLHAWQLPLIVLLPSREKVAVGDRRMRGRTDPPISL
jgi:hypothetical protein